MTTDDLQPSTPNPQPTNHPQRRSRLAEQFGLPRLDTPGAKTIFIATWIDAVGTGLFLTFLLLYLNKVANFSLGTAGLVLTITSAIALAANPLAGSLVDKVGPRAMSVAAKAINAVGYGGLLFVEGSIPLLAIFSFFAVLGDRIFWVGFPSLISQMAPENERDRWFAFTGMTREAGFGIGGLIAAGIVAFMGESGYRVLLSVNAFTFLVAALILQFRVPRPVVETHEGAHGGWKAVLRDKPVMNMAVANTLAAAAIMSGFLAMPVYVVDHLDLDDWVPGLLFTAWTLVLAIGQGPGLRLVAGWRRTRVYALAGSIWIAGAIAFSIAQVLPTSLVLPYLFLAVVITVGGDVFQAPQNNGFPSAMAPPALRGRYLAMFSFSWGFARAIGPGLIAGLFALGTTGPWIGMMILAAGMIVMALRAEKMLDPDRQRMPRSFRPTDL
jgi:MFS family permease